MAIAPDGSTAYITNHNSNNVSVLDTATNTISATVAVGTSPAGIAITPDGANVYVANEISGTGTVSVINTSNNTVSATSYGRLTLAT